MNGRYLCACICAGGKDIAAVLGAKTRGDGCIKGNGVAVNWGGRTPTENSSSRCLWRAPEKLELGHTYNPACGMESARQAENSRSVQDRQATTQAGHRARDCDGR